MSNQNAQLLDWVRWDSHLIICSVHLCSPIIRQLKRSHYRKNKMLFQATFLTQTNLKRGTIKITEHEATSAFDVSYNKYLLTVHSVQNYRSKF